MASCQGAQPITLAKQPANYHPILSIEPMNIDKAPHDLQLPPRDFAAVIDTTSTTLTQQRKILQSDGKTAGPKCLLPSWNPFTWSKALHMVARVHKTRSCHQTFCPVPPPLCPISTNNLVVHKKKPHTVSLNLQLMTNQPISPIGPPLPNHGSQ